MKEKKTKKLKRKKGKRKVGSKMTESLNDKPRNCSRSSASLENFEAWSPREG
jgi:hypothetical protein